MSEPVKCERCGSIGQRSLKFPAPAGWYFLVARDENGHIEGDFYVYACSVACRQALWQRGPGAPLPDGDHALRVLRGAYADGPPPPPRQRAVAVAKPPPKCTCNHAPHKHGEDGCFHRDGHDRYCPCPWVPATAPITVGTVVVHKQDCDTGTVVSVGTSTYSVMWDDNTWSIVPQENVRRAE